LHTDAAAVAWMTGPFLAACALLAWSGANKAARPAATRAAARAAGLPSSISAVRGFGAIEITLAAAGAAFGGVAALLVAGMFLLLAATASRLHRRAPATPCGCLGARSEAPASRAHVVVDAAAAVVALITAFGGPPLAIVAQQPFAAVPFVVLVVCATRLAVLAMELGPGSAGAKEAL
jgi:hypothetical protein